MRLLFEGGDYSRAAMYTSCSYYLRAVFISLGAPDCAATI